MSRYPAYIVPPKYVRDMGDAEFAARPVGTGAYRFVRWLKDDHVLLEANTQYWRGKPRIEKIIWRTIPDDVARVAALQRGEADIIEPLPVDWVETVERSPRLRAERVKHGGLIVYLGLRFDVPPLNDRRVRQAMAYAIDVDTIVSKILRGFATPIGTQVGPFDFGYSPNVPRYRYNPAKAKALLAEAGFPNGFDIAFQGTRRYLKGGDVSQALAEQLTAVGVRAKLEIPEWQVYVQLVPVKKQAAIYMLGWGSTQTLDADAAIYAIMRSGEPYSTISIAKLDQLLDEARRTIDPSARAQLYRQIQTLAHDEVPMLTLYQEDAVYGINNRVLWKGRADARLPVFDMRFQQ
jgi:peptide/nickel transport system substrate-binding protein